MSMESTTVAAYLASHPDFFEEHTELLSSVRLSSGLSGRAISLQERQMEVLREKYKQLELKMADADAQRPGKRRDRRKIPAVDLQPAGQPA